LATFIRIAAAEPLAVQARSVNSGGRWLAVGGHAADPLEECRQGYATISGERVKLAEHECRKHMSCPVL